MPELRIFRRELVANHANLTCFIATRLIEAGAPIKIHRKNRFDVSDLKPSEIEFTGKITQYEDFSTNDFVYKF